MDNPRKTEKLDDAFLFILSSVGLVISFIQITMKELTEIIEAMPFLLLGIVLPFFVGYLKGAIEIDSVEERMRGWIYFVIGTSSYFAFFIFVRINAEYVVKEGVFLFLVVFGLLIAYKLLRWSKKVFDIRSPSSQYAFSGTAICAVASSFLFRLIIGLYSDFQGRDIYEIILTNPTELLFWIWIILSSFSIVLIFEKASENALQNELELPRQFSGWSRRIVNFSLIKGLLLGTMLFEYTFDFNLKARLLWIQAFVFWFLGCLFWVVRAPLLPQVFLLAAIISGLVAAIIFHRMRMTSFRNIQGAFPNKLSYCLLIFVAIFTMLFSGNIQSGVLVIILSTVLYILPYIHNRKP